MIWKGGKGGDSSRNGYVWIHESVCKQKRDHLDICDIYAPTRILEMAPFKRRKWLLKGIEPPSLPHLDHGLHVVQKQGKKRDQIVPRDIQHTSLAGYSSAVMLWPKRIEIRQRQGRVVGVVVGDKTFMNERYPMRETSNWETRLSSAEFRKHPMFLAIPQL